MSKFYHNSAEIAGNRGARVTRAFAVLALVAIAVLAATPAKADSAKTTAAAIASDTQMEDGVPMAAFVYNGASMIYSISENTTGYRGVTSMEPASDETQPLYNMTYYPTSDTPTGLDLTCDDEEGPQLNGSSTTVVLHTVIPLAP